MLSLALAAQGQAWAALLNALAVAGWFREALSNAVVALRQPRVPLWGTWWLRGKLMRLLVHGRYDVIHE